MVRMRTIQQTIKYLKEKDPDSALSEWWLRESLRNGTLKHHKAGSRYLINIDYLMEFLRNPENAGNEDNNTNEKIRKVK